MRHLGTFPPSGHGLSPHASKCVPLAGEGGPLAITRLPEDRVRGPLSLLPLFWGSERWQEFLGSGKQIPTLWVHCQPWAAYSGQMTMKKPPSREPREQAMLRFATFQLSVQPHGPLRAAFSPGQARPAAESAGVKGSP